MNDQPILRHYQDRYTTFLFRASFAWYNAAYHNDLARVTCANCYGLGHVEGSELIGDPLMIGYQYFSEPCNACIGNEQCPNCSAPLALSFDLSAFDTASKGYQDPLAYNYVAHFDYIDAIGSMPFDGFTCLCCGWSYDPDDDPGFDPMFLM